MRCDGSEENNSFDMSNILPLERWKNMPIAEREAFYSDTDSDEKNSDYEEVVIPKVKRKRDIEEENSNVKRTKLILKPNPQTENTKNATPGFERCTRTSWQASKTVQTKQVEGLIYPFSKRIREGKHVY